MKVKWDLSKSPHVFKIFIIKKCYSKANGDKDSPEQAATIHIWYLTDMEWMVIFSIIQLSGILTIYNFN